jgi:sugar phosphate permease
MGLDVAHASYYSIWFDVCGILPAVAAGWALDRVFKGNWAMLCLIMAVGMVFGYLTVLRFETSPLAVALAFGVVGFMIYGPDTLLCGAASVQVAGEANGLAVAGLVNGMGSIGPIIQEEVIGRFMGNDELTGMHRSNLLGLSMAIALTLILAVITWHYRKVQKRAETHRLNALEEAAK